MCLVPQHRRGKFKDRTIEPRFWPLLAQNWPSDCTRTIARPRDWDRFWALVCLNVSQEPHPPSPGEPPKTGLSAGISRNFQEKKISAKAIAKKWQDFVLPILSKSLLVIPNLFCHRQNTHFSTKKKQRSGALCQNPQQASGRGPPPDTWDFYGAIVGFCRALPGFVRLRTLEVGPSQIIRGDMTQGKQRQATCDTPCGLLMDRYFTLSDLVDLVQLVWVKKRGKNWGIFLKWSRILGYPNFGK